MPIREAKAQYTAALKAGQKCYREAVLKGRYPYPQVLDEILDEHLAAGRAELGLIDIPMDRIVGTKSKGRRNAFAADFMPLLPIDTEFGIKWVNLCAAHLGSGIREPVVCYEYLGNFYIQEGNKRVSVLKHFGAARIPAMVIRVMPTQKEKPRVQAYYEFVEFFQNTGPFFPHRRGSGGIPDHRCRSYNPDQSRR